MTTGTNEQQRPAELAAERDDQDQSDDEGEELLQKLADARS